MISNSEKTMDKIVALCKNRGFVYAGSEIYGGLANSGITVRSVLNSKITSSARGGRSRSGVRIQPRA